MNVRTWAVIVTAAVLGPALFLGTAAFNSNPAFAAPAEINLLTGSSHSPPQITSGCDVLTLNSAQSVVPTEAGVPSTLDYGCGDGGASAAFTTGHSHGAKRLTLTPVFTLPRGWSLGIGLSATYDECSHGAVGLSSGIPLTLSPDTGYFYCLSSTSASSFSSFSISWTQ